MTKTEITRDVGGDLYQELLAAAFSRATEVGFVVRKDPPSQLTARLLGLLGSEILSDSLDAAWPGTILLDARARVVVCRASSKTLQAIQEAAETLFRWQDSLPEDLFLRNETRVILETVSHEGFALIDLPPDEPIVARLIQEGVAKPQDGMSGDG